MASSFRMFLISLFLVALSSRAVPASCGGDADKGLTHIHLYIHALRSGPNRVPPLRANSSFGSIGVVDDELRVGPDKASEVVGRFQGIIVGTDVERGSRFLTSDSFVFTAGEYNGSTLSIEGPVLDFSGTIERAVVGGTGKFRLARGYSLAKALGNSPPLSSVFNTTVFVLMHRSKY